MDPKSSASPPPSLPYPPPPSQATSDQATLSRSGIVLSKIRLGYGTYSKVKEAYDLNRKRRIAVKIIDCLRAPADFQEKFLPRELRIWARVRHPNIVQMYDYMVAESRIYMLLELAEGGDMLTYLQRLDEPISEAECKYWMRQMCEAIAYLHERNIIHRDLKLENLLIDAKNQLKLCDFGFSKELEPTTTTTAALDEDELSRTYCGSKAYASPEILLGEPYDPRKADVWACGCIFFIFITGRMPFREDSCNMTILKQQKSNRLSVSIRSCPVDLAAKRLLRRMLEYDWRRRAFIDQAMASAWLDTANPGTPSSSSRYSLRSATPRVAEKRRVSSPTPPPTSPPPAPSNPPQTAPQASPRTSIIYNLRSSCKKLFRAKS